MACSTFSKRVINHKLSFFILSLTLLPLVLKSGEFEFGLELTYDQTFFVFFSGSYKTNYIETKAHINPYKSFPNNISLQALPVHNPKNTELDDAISTALAFSLKTTGGALLYAAQKEIERRIENQNVDSYLQRCDKAIEKSDSDFKKIERRRFHD